MNKGMSINDQIARADIAMQETLRTKKSKTLLTIEELTKRMNKTTIYVVVTAYGAILLYPSTVGNTINYRGKYGYVECDGDGNVRKFDFEPGNGQLMRSVDAMGIVDSNIHLGNEVAEILVEGQAELESTGELVWESDCSDKPEKWVISW